ncbi:MAG: lipopolysaccharide biosynthesis protein [SAR202 cluster bacterium]|nr:lipopolysaccharide biosynthesis protein [SAR202 cluster bacterium]
MLGKLRWLWRPEQNTGRRILRAGLWIFILRASLRGFSAIKTIILARLLAPHDFGLFGVALLLLALVDVFTYTGFRNALIQRQDDIKSHLDTAWTVEVIRGAVLGIALALAAPWVAALLGASEATELVRAMALALFLNGLVNIAIVYFDKELEMQRRFLYEISYSVVDVVLGIVLVLIMRNVWALVISSLAATAVRVGASYVLHPYRPRPRLEREKAMALFHFGKWVFASYILNYAVRNLSDVLVSRFAGVAALGLYRMAHNLAEMATTELTVITNQVLFPTWAMLQSRREVWRPAFLRALSIIALLSFPIGAILIPLAYDVTKVVLGDKWLPMVAAFQLLIANGMIRSVSTTIGPFFMGMGRPEIGTKLMFAKLILLAAMAIPMTIWWGMVGAAAALLISSSIVDVAGFVIANRMVGTTSMDVVRVLLFPGLSALAAAGAIVALDITFHPQARLGELVGMVALGGFVYLLALVVCWKVFHYNVGGLLGGARRAAMAARNADVPEREGRI